MINGPVWDESELGKNSVYPTILAIGDSWFWYPFNNLLNRLHRIVNERHNNVILVRGQNGAEAIEYMQNPIRRMIESDLDQKRGYGSTIQAVFVSGGGNDFAGYDDLGGILKKNCSKAIAPADCFVNGQPDKLFSTVAQAVGDLADMVKKYVGGGIPVLIHTYDYAQASGKGFLGLGQWLKEPMDAHGVPQGLQQAVVKFLIDIYSGILQGLTAQYPNLIVVNTRGALGPDDWANELHPTMAGFNKIAEHWRPSLQKLGLS